MRFPVRVVVIIGKVRAGRRQQGRLLDQDEQWLTHEI